MKIKDSLKKFYNQEAEKYYFTRKKYRTDWYIILDEIKKNPKKSISILEFWCGSWRLISFLNKNIKDKKIKYIWVDLSKKLLEFAKKENPNNSFIEDDISKYIKKTKQESLDYIIWIASFHHIPNQKERLFLLRNFYRSLNYWWKLIMTNWSISKRFIKKYFKSIIKSLLKFIYTFGNYNRNDLYIPWKNRWKIEQRFYHMFTIKEIKSLTKTAWFKTETLTHLDNNWQTTKDRKFSNNTIFIWKKSVFN